MSSNRTSDNTSKYCVKTSITAYKAWLHVVVIHSDFYSKKKKPAKIQGEQTITTHHADMKDLDDIFALLSQH